MSDTLSLPGPTVPTLARGSGRLIATILAIVVVAVVSGAVVALAWPSSSAEPARDVSGASVVAERIDCRPGQPC
jgi:flagellar basal body-associated protein FliL